MTWRIWVLFGIVFGLLLLPAETGTESENSHPLALSWANSLVDVCPAAPGDLAPPDFLSSTCNVVSMERLESVGDVFWVRVSFPSSQALNALKEPLGLSVVGHSARTYVLNGNPIGAAGAPGFSKEEEEPGRLEDILYLPEESLRDGDQELVMLMSCHHRRDARARCLDTAYLANYAYMNAYGLTENLSKLMLFSVLIVGCIFFAAMTIRGSDRVGSTFLSLICGVACLVSILKCLHFLTSFAYPVEHMRLTAIALCSFLVGVFCASFVLSRFSDQKFFAIMAVASVFSIAPIAGTNDLEFAATFGLATPIFTAALFTTGWAVAGRAYTLQYAALLWLILTIMAWQNGDILIQSAFYAVISTVTFFFVNYTGLLDRRSDLDAKTKKLEHALQNVQAELAATQDDADPGADEQVMVKLSGRTQYVRVGSISHCNGARDYVELCFVDGQEILHSGSLQELEKTLPEIFIRVHRSHIVNVHQIQALWRQSNGSGILKMCNGSEIAVSRRIMPNIKGLLDKGGVPVLASNIGAMDLKDGASV